MWVGTVHELQVLTQVTTSEHIDAARLLLLVPKGGFLELRARLLERLDRHMDALRWLLLPVLVSPIGVPRCAHAVQKQASALAAENMW